MRFTHGLSQFQRGCLGCAVAVIVSSLPGVLMLLFMMGWAGTQMWSERIDWPSVFAIFLPNLQQVFVFGILGFAVGWFSRR